MTRTMSIDEFPLAAREHLGRIASDGETIIVVQNERPVVEIRPLPQPVLVRDLIAVMESLPRLSLEEAEAFSADIEQARREMNAIPLRDPWES